MTILIFTFRSKLETTLQKVKKEMEVERDHVKEREKKMNENTIKLENDIKVSFQLFFVLYLTCN